MYALESHRRQKCQIQQGKDSTYRIPQSVLCTAYRLSHREKEEEKSFLTTSMRPCVKGVGTYLKTPEKMRVGVRDIERQHRHHLGCEEACSAYYWSVQRVQVLLCQLCGCSMTTASVWRWSVESLIQSKMWYSRAFESQEETRLREYQEHEHEMVDGGAGERQMRSGARV